MGDKTHKNHIVPQFYLKQWYNQNEEFYYYDFVHGDYSVGTSGSLGWLLDTYSQELEDCLAEFEDKISKVYPTIIKKLEDAQWKNSLSQRREILTPDEEYALLSFMYIQSRRTISGRLMLADEGLDEPLSAYAALDLAKKQNDKLLSELESLSREKVYGQLKDKYRVVLRTPRYYPFWTSSNPVYYGVFNEMFCPVNSMDQHFKMNDTMIFTLSPRLKLCLTYKDINTQKRGWVSVFPKDMLSVIPLDTSLQNANPWKDDKDKILRSLNFGLVQGFEMQAKKSKTIDYRGSRFYIISQKQFADADKEQFNKFHIEGIR